MFPHVQIRWSDFSLDKSSKLSANYEKNIIQEYPHDVKSATDGQIGLKQQIDSKVSLALSKISVVFKRLGLLQSSDTIVSYEAELEPYHMTLRESCSSLLPSDALNCALSGAKTSVKVQGSIGSAKAWTDQGTTLSAHGKLSLDINI